MTGPAARFHRLRWLAAVLLSLLWATTGRATVRAEHSDFAHSLIAANSGGGAGRLRLNFGGKGEARGFIDVVPDDIMPGFVNGRPFTSQFTSGSATDIFARFAPVSPEMARLSQAGTRITILEPAGVAGKQAEQLMGWLGGRGAITLDRTFTAQSLQSMGGSMAGQEVQIIKILVGQ